MLFLTAALALAQTPAQLDVSQTPVFEVSIEVAVKGNVDIRRQEVAPLVLSALENAGTRSKMRFVYRDQKTARESMFDRDRSGNWVFQPGGERGNLVRPTHMLRATVIIDRNVSSKSEKVTVPLGDIALDRILGRGKGKTIERYGRRVKESVVATIRVNAFDIMSGLSVQAVPTVEGHADSEMLQSNGTVLFHRETLKLWILTIPIKVKDAEHSTLELRSSRSAPLTSAALDTAANGVAEALSNLTWTVNRQVIQPDFTLDTLTVDRKTITIKGDLSKLTKGGLLNVPIMPTNRELAVGEPSVIVAKVTNVGGIGAAASFYDPSTAAYTALPSGFFVDLRRPLTKLTDENPNELRVDSLSQDRSSLVLAGELASLRVGDILVIPLAHQGREGDGSSAYAKVVRLGKDAAVAFIWDIVTQKPSRIDSYYNVDPRRPVRKL